MNCLPRPRHDPFLKLFYRAAARDAVTLFFPDLAARIDWQSLQWIEKEVPILSEPPRSIVADLVGLTRDVEGRYLEVLIHPEIQMRTAADMGWRVLQYNAGLTLQQASAGARVLTIVFYHCRGAGGVREERHRLEFYGHSVLEAGYWSVGLGDLDADQYAESENPAAWALASWMRQRRAGRVELRLRLLGKILRFVRDEPYRRLLLDAVRTYFSLSGREAAEEEQLLQSQTYGEVNEMLQTELGRLEDAAERKAFHNAIVTVLRSRFTAVPERLMARIGRVQDVAALEELIGRAAVVSSLEEFESLLELS